MEIGIPRIGSIDSSPGWIAPLATHARALWPGLSPVEPVNVHPFTRSVVSLPQLPFHEREPCPSAFPGRMLCAKRTDVPRAASTAVGNPMMGPTTLVLILDQALTAHSPH